MKKRFSEEERAEIRSSYDKIPMWLNANKDVIKRKPKKDAQGNMVEKSANLIPVLKTITMNQSRIKGTPYEQMVAALRYLVENVMEISPQTFYNKYDTVFLKQYKLYSAVMYLIDNAPGDIKKECYFNHKDILFRSLWPEFYEKNLAGSITAHDILYADNDTKDMFKSNIIRAGQVKNISKKDKGCSDGELVDEMLFEAIKQELFVDSKLCSTMKECFYVLGELSKKEEQNGGNEIAQSRGYRSILDFFYLNLPASIQEDKGLDFLEARKNAGLAPEPIMEVAILARLGEYDRLAMEYKVGEEDMIDREIAI